MTPREDLDKDRVKVIHWSIKSYDKHEISFHVEFDNPIEISQTEKSDSLTIILRLGAFTDVNGRPLSPEEILTVTLPRQIPSVTEAESIAEGGSATEAVSFFVIIFF